MFKKIKKYEKIYTEDKIGNLILNTEIQYDQSEKIVWEQHLFPSGEIQSESEFEYNSEKIIREKTWNEFEEWTEIKYLSVYCREEVHKDDLLIKKIENNFDGSNEVLITTYQYDEYNRIVKIVLSNKSGKMKQQELNIYNKDATVIQTFILNESDSFDKLPEKKQFRRIIEYY